MARSMVTLYGMSDKMGMVALESVQSRYLDGSRALNCSEETATKIDKEVRDMMKRSYRKAYKLLKENESVLDALAEYLIEKETITGKEFMKIYHEITGDVLKEATEEGADSISEESVVLGNGIDATV
jgi:cell division protease FtsH